ncbi:MAG: hypothetical protein J0L53_13690 [Spirochaetes bacterium]|nr:hypothetical protein [Spirochaetota bacterium]
MTQRLRAIILNRKASPDESLYLDTLLESGEFAGFRIPGILKSAKRSSFHYAPGGIYEMIFAASGGGPRFVPKSSELLFSPYSDSQDYKILSAVAEIVRVAEFVKTAPENAELFELMGAALTGIAGATSLDRHLDKYYWDFLLFLGLAADAEPGAEYRAYDLTSGFLTARELAERPHADFILPYGWVTGERGDSAAARETIRRFLRNL